MEHVDLFLVDLQSAPHSRLSILSGATPYVHINIVTIDLFINLSRKPPERLWTQFTCFSSREMEIISRGPTLGLSLFSQRARCRTLRLQDYWVQEYTLPSAPSIKCNVPVLRESLSEGSQIIPSASKRREWWVISVNLCSLLCAVFISWWKRSCSETSTFTLVFRHWIPIARFFHLCFQNKKKVKKCLHTGMFLEHLWWWCPPGWSPSWTSALLSSIWRLRWDLLLL